MKKRLLFILLCLIYTFTSAQDVLENNPASVHWLQLNTPSFRIIFPEDFEEQARHVANNLEKVHDKLAIGAKSPRKIDIILRNKQAISNGFVTLGPRRSEFYTMPPQDYNFVGTNQWLDLLSVHEYRHIAQYQQSKNGFNKFLFYLFGQNTQAGLAFSAVPRWFWEGDATVMETVHTRSGRGSIPEFSRMFKTNLLEKNKYNYHKQLLGSYKDHIPNEYKLGIYMTAHIRKRTNDPEIWDKVTTSAFSWPFIPFTFSNALKKHTGTYLVDNYDMMMDDLEKAYQAQMNGLKPSAFEQITTRQSDDYTDYSYPQVLEDGSIVVLKSGIGDAAQLVKYNKEGEQLDRFMTGIMNSTGMLSSANNKVVWNEYGFHPRWRAETFSVIKSYDFATKELNKITTKSRYSGAALSADGAKIATSLYTLEGKNYLVVLDAMSGEELQRFSGPANALYSMPSWGGDKIIALKTGNEGRSVVSVDAASGQENVLINAGNENIGYPKIYGGFLLFNSPITGIDNIYAFSLSSGERYQVTNSKYGAYNPNVSQNGKHIYYNEHTENGLDIVRMAFIPEEWLPMDNVVDRNIHYFDEVAEQEKATNILEGPEKDYPVKNYSEIGHIYNVHSWGPYATADLTRAQFGIFSRDVLSTTAMELGYTYDIDEETGFGSASVSYQGWFPIIDLEVQRGSRSSDEGVFNGEQLEFEWKETSIIGGVRVPLLLTRSKYVSELTLNNNVGYTQVSDFSNSILEGSRFAPVNDSLAYFFRDFQDNGDLIYNKASISYYRLLKQSHRDILSQRGQSVALELYNTPYGGDFSGRLFAARANVYFPSPLRLFVPGFARHHVFYLTGGYQSRLADISNDIYYFRNRIPKPRGFSYPQHDKFKTISANYTFPLWYPDIAIGPLLYLKRFRVNGFYDWGDGDGKYYYMAPENTLYFSDISRTYRSIGAELILDFNVMRFTPEISLGVRYSYLLTTNEVDIDFLLVNINF